MTRRRGYILVMVMFISLVLVVSGMAWLTAQNRNYQAASSTIQAVQARALAEAGIEDARSKLEKDSQFPPPPLEDQNLFTYSETLQGVQGGGSVGTFTVAVDVSLAGAPYYVVMIRSEGSLGPGQSSHVIRCEIDVCPHRRSNPSLPNDDPYGILNWQEEGVNL